MGKSVGKYCYVLFLFMQLCPFSPFFKSLEVQFQIYCSYSNVAELLCFIDCDTKIMNVYQNTQN
jgi:hypothetical protein